MENEHKKVHLSQCTINSIIQLHILLYHNLIFYANNSFISFIPKIVTFVSVHYFIKNKVIAMFKML